MNVIGIVGASSGTTGPAVDKTEVREMVRFCCCCCCCGGGGRGGVTNKRLLLCGG